jgi:hypothetical protein
VADPTVVQGSSLPQLVVQGIAVPQAAVNPPEFFKRTRRQRFQLASPVSTFAGLGATDVVEARKAGILAAIDIKFEGTLTITPGTGTVATTYKWPLDLIKACRISVNGGSYVVNCSGAKLRARQMMTLPGLTDRGVAETVAGATLTQGTLGLASESWGVGSATTGLSSGNYSVSLQWRVPIAWDLTRLFGALFLQTSATAVDIAMDWAPSSDLFAFTGNGAATLTGGWVAEGIVFTIPTANGQIYLPDLSVYHTMLQSNFTGIGQTSNEYTLPGQGVGKSLQRVFGQLWQGSSSPGAPVPLTIANYGQLGWRYGGNQTPELYTDGHAMRAALEESYGVDFGSLGFWCFDFANYWSFRDAVDEGDATELRVLLQVLSSLGSTVRLETVQEAMVAGAQAG